MLLITAFIWGAAFVAQSVGMDYVGPFTFNAVRCLIGGAVLIPVILILNKNTKTQSSAKYQNRRDLWIGGALCGAALFAASTLQQIGIQYTTVGKAGFITALYIVLVPLLGLFFNKKAPFLVWISVILAVAGLYLLCMSDNFDINKGDLLLMLCAVFFSVHILIIDHFSTLADGVKMSCIQFFICSILSAAGMIIFENPDINNILLCWLPIGYAGVFSCGVAYTLQIIAQKHTEPTLAALLLSLESVFAVICGWILLGEKLMLREAAGCMLIFIAVILAQLPAKKTSEKHFIQANIKKE